MAGPFTQGVRHQSCFLYKNSRLFKDPNHTQPDHRSPLGRRIQMLLNMYFMSCSSLTDTPSPLITFMWFYFCKKGCGGCIHHLQSSSQPSSIWTWTWCQRRLPCIVQASFTWSWGIGVPDVCCFCSGWNWNRCPSLALSLSCVFVTLVTTI